MSEFLTEPSSQRADNKIWIWKYGDEVNVPFKISMLKKSDNSQYYDIPTTMTARFIIKADLRDVSTVVDKMFNFTSPNIFVVELSTEEVVQLRPERTYYVGVGLYDEFGNFIRTLVSELPLRVNRSAMYSQVF